MSAARAALARVVATDGFAAAVVSRLINAVAVVFGAMLLLFALQALVPGDPAAVLLGPQATPEYAARFVAAMGLDQPLPVRFQRFLAHVLSGDLGQDVLTGRPVVQMIAAVLPNTLALTAAAIGLALLLGVPLGIVAATHRGSALDHVLAAVSVSFIAIPSFVVGIVLLVMFSVWLDWLPVLGASRTGAFWDEAQRLVLPAAALALGWIGYIARLVRASMLDVLREPHIRTARAFGIDERRILFVYALKNACLPTLAVLGLGIGQLLGGAVLVEIVFARPGLGQLVLDAIVTRNFPVVQGAVLVVVVLFALTTLVLDLLQMAIDPRLRGARRALP